MLLLMLQVGLRKCEGWAVGSVLYAFLTLQMPTWPVALCRRPGWLAPCSSPPAACSWHGGTLSCRLCEPNS